ncbi:glycosyltransferase, MGT family [Terriglobus saanensis SP1PR4]|uniref:Glycosyltransferase, MGT family n=2 Tax=Terriglobus saanensis TaxID=870903 RepID=E8V5P0_TERSS|nr:glycosyltransferase, MGT family [Terriglobus saanensis SP1PR4]
MSAAHCRISVVIYGTQRETILARIGFLILSGAGHLYPSVTLAKALQERGNEIVFFGVPDVTHVITEQGLNFVPYGFTEYPVGTLQRVRTIGGSLKGQEAIQFYLQRAQILAQAAFRDLPQLISGQKIEALVIDQLFPGGATVALHLDLPYASLANALAVNKESGVPPPMTSWDYEIGTAAEKRNGDGWQRLKNAHIPLRDFDNAQRIAWGLDPYEDVWEDSFSSLAQISNQPKAFDLPRKQLPANFYYVGPLFQATSRQLVAFPWERLDGRPLIYASMGTAQNGLEWVFRAILEACAGLDVQLILSLGAGVITADDLDIPANAIVVPYAPQPQMLERAAVCITHAGLNTALESLSHGVPMIAIPITTDQPGVAARIRYTQTGEVIPLEELTAGRLRDLIHKVMGESSYRERSRALQQAFIAERPLIRACEIIESKVLSEIRRL